MKRVIWLTVCIIYISGVACAEMFATLAEDGKIWTFDSDDFYGTTNQLAVLPSEGAYLDVTYGDGLIYALRNDGKVFSCDLSGNTGEVALVGWGNAFFKIDYASGVLYGLRELSGGLHYGVYDASNNQALVVYNRTAMDFGVRTSGNISVLQGTTQNKMLTFTNGYIGPDSGVLSVTYFSNDTSDAPLSLDINDELASALTAKSTGAEEWKYQDGLGNSIIFGQANVYDADYLVISTNGSETLFMDAEYGGDVMRILDEARNQVGLIPRFGSAGVGIVAIDAAAVTSSGYEAWAELYSLTNGASGDDDGDGVANLTEYGLGGNPTNFADPGVLPELVFGESNMISYTYVELTNSERGISYTVELNDDLVSGTWTNSGWTAVVTNSISEPPGFEQIQYQISSDGEQKQFFRLKITNP